MSHSNPASPCVVAPSHDSSVVATNAANTQTAAPRTSACPSAAATPAKNRLAPTPASVPSRLTAPSVPRGTRVNGGVDRYVVFPYALPTSLAVVSLSLEQKDATKPSRYRSGPGGKPPSAASAQTAPATPLPHTDPTPLRPPLASAMPSRCFCSSLIFVTALPNTKYRHTSA